MGAVRDLAVLSPKARLILTVPPSGAAHMSLRLPDVRGSAHNTLAEAAGLHRLTHRLLDPAARWVRSCPLLWAAPHGVSPRASDPTLTLHANGATTPFLSLSPRPWRSQTPAPFTAQAKADGQAFHALLHALPTCTGPFFPYQGQKQHSSDVLHFAAGSEEDALLVFFALSSPNAIWSGKIPGTPALLSRSVAPADLRTHAAALSTRLAPRP